MDVLQAATTRLLDAIHIRATAIMCTAAFDGGTSDTHGMRPMTTLAHDRCARNHTCTVSETGCCTVHSRAAFSQLRRLLCQAPDHSNFGHRISITS